MTSDPSNLVRAMLKLPTYDNTLLGQNLLKLCQYQKRQHRTLLPSLVSEADNIPRCG